MIKRISVRWFFWFSLVAIYAIIIGGLLYFNLFKIVFDKNLQNQVIDTVRQNASTLIEGLVTKNYLTVPENEIISSWPRQDNRITNVVYFNGNGTVRWHKNLDLLDMPITDYQRGGYLETNAIELAVSTGNPSVKMKKEGNYYEIAIPLKAKGNKIAGIISVDVSRKQVKEEIKKALTIYLLGSVIIFILMGFLLYIFVIKSVTNPLLQLAEGIDNISTKSFVLNFSSRSDEVGLLARAVEGFLGKVKKELEEQEAVEQSRFNYEQEWWSSVLAITIAKGTRAIVVDENNNIMHANFELKIEKEGPIHLLDIFGGTQKDIVNIVGKAMDNPGKIFKTDTKSGSRIFTIKALQLMSKGGIIRTMIILEPKK